ncbi:hypothetical protein ACSBRS_000705 [Streptococcus suis]|uniref:hypothetical protein n=1 Tax=Streptococcus suis TaxID=1307 RepID=UPI000CF4EDDE|nr:hypothetical protein [Streptococcus suis]MBY5027533.1 hypothetical protein [Streptococcus suis]HEM3013697.1 hypothetical protein [Streptococcus suis]
MKKILLLLLSLLAITTLGACSSNTESAPKYTDEQLKTLDEFATTLEKWLDKSADTNVFMEDENVVVQIAGYDFSKNSETSVLELSQTILEQKKTVFETYKITEKELEEPLLVFRDGTGKTYTVENKDGKMEVKK